MIVPKPISWRALLTVLTCTVKPEAWEMSSQKSDGRVCIYYFKILTKLKWRDILKSPPYIWGKPHGSSLQWLHQTKNDNQLTPLQPSMMLHTEIISLSRFRFKSEWVCHAITCFCNLNIFLHVFHFLMKFDENEERVK